MNVDDMTDEEFIDYCRNELGDLEDILQSIANEEKELRGGR